MKEETLEEAAEKLYREYPNNPLDKPEWHYNRDVDCFKKRKAFIAGASWQQERMYSEEEVILLLEYVRQNYYDTGTIWHSDSDVAYTSEELIEQFKKNKQ